MTWKLFQEKNLSIHFTRLIISGYLIFYLLKLTG